MRTVATRTAACTYRRVHLLTRVAAQKNGEKKLRAQLTRTPEWRSAAAREALAARLHAAGDVDFAAALRRPDASALRKRHLFALARAWGYASDVWRARGERAPAAPRASAAAEAPARLRASLLATLAPPPAPAVAPPRHAPPPCDEAAALRALHADAVEMHVALRLLPLATAASDALAGRAAHAAALRHGAARAQLSDAFVAHCHAIAAAAAVDSARLRSEHAALEARRAALAAALPGGMSADAWRAAHGGGSGAEAVLAHLAGLIQLSLVSASAATSAAACGAAPPLCPGEACALEEAREASAAAREFVLRCDTLLTATAHGDADLYLRAAAGVIDAVARFCAGVHAACTERAGWAASLLAAGRAQAQPADGAAPRDAAAAVDA